MSSSDHLVSATATTSMTTTTTATGTVRRKKTAVEQPEDGRGSTAEREVEEREVARTLVVGAAAAAAVVDPSSVAGGSEEIDNEGEYESDFTSSSLSSSSPDQVIHSSNKGEEGDEPGTPRTSLSNSPSSSTSRQMTRRNDSPKTPIANVPDEDDTLRVRKKPQLSNSPGKAPVTRKQKQDAAAALGATAGSGGDRPLTRRQRKLLGLPKLRRMAGPYDRREGPTTRGGGGKGDEESEWKKNGTGRVDVRGFRELKI